MDCITRRRYAVAMEALRTMEKMARSVAEAHQQVAGTDALLDAIADRRASRSKKSKIAPPVVN